MSHIKRVIYFNEFNALTRLVLPLFRVEDDQNEN